MNIVFLNGSIIGSNTKVAIEKAEEMFKEKYSAYQTTLIDLAHYDLPFSDGRNYFEYDGDAKEVTTKIMEADAIVIGTPIFQASIPGTLKNIFDLLPVNGLRNKIVSIIVTAGTAKHFLMVEQQLKPILTYMKAQIVPTYVFIEEQDMIGQNIINDDVIFRMERLIEDTVMYDEVFKKIQEEKNKLYDF
ncbi:MAG TPA: NAD(P)H-dependent oxidoreductase [Bacillota bacterium]|nr:NAD(P)H-dependent oxidoreductase [Bacillota bacterium]